jgi:hypothetical protein
MQYQVKMLRGIDKVIKRLNLLGIFDLILALGAIYTGIMMMGSKTLFTEFPPEWIHKVPFESWFAPGIIAIVVFGLGNIMAAYFSFKKNSKHPWLLSAFMGGIFFTSMIFQVIILGEWYLVTLEFLVFSIIQLSLSASYFRSCRKRDAVMK